MGHQPKLRNVKMEYEEENVGCHMKKEDLNAWSHHHKSTYLQKCLSDQQNYKNVIMG